MSAQPLGSAAHTHDSQDNVHVKFYGQAYEPEYGAAMQKLPAMGKTINRVSQGKKVNLVAMFFSVVLPWGIFVSVYADLSFSFHYWYPAISALVLWLITAIVAVSGCLALHSICREREEHDPVWFIFIFITFFMALAFGYFFGEHNYDAYTGPFYDTRAMNTYSDVDPAEFKGQELMDAGVIHFKEGVRVDRAYSMGFKNHNMYCVAPIGAPHADTYFHGQPQFDMWAVGTDCCEGGSGDFHCGSSTAATGVRLMAMEQRNFYLLAVQQAEAAYNVMAPQPVLVTLTDDPTGNMLQMYRKGVENFMYAAIVYFVIQLLLVAIFTLRTALSGATQTQQSNSHHVVL